MGRTLQQLRASLAHLVAIVVENKPGAATNLGADFVAKAPPDGYTMLLGDVATYAAQSPARAKPRNRRAQVPAFCALSRLQLHEILLGAAERTGV